RSLLRSSGSNIGDDCVALGRLQVRAISHRVDDARPVFEAVMPDRRQGVTFDAAISVEPPPFAGLRQIDMLGFTFRKAVRSDIRWSVFVIASGKCALLGC